MTDYKLTHDKAAAVARHIYWDHDMRTCPLGAKVLLLGAGGVAAIEQRLAADLAMPAYEVQFRGTPADPGRFLHLERVA